MNKKTTKGKQNKGSETSVAKSVADSLANQPEVSSAIDGKKTDDGDSGLVVLTDKKGDDFDAEKHVVGADGKPEMTRAGNFKKKSGRPDGAKTSARSIVDRTRTNAADSEAEADKIKTKEAARSTLALTHNSASAVADGLFMVGRALGGEEWIPVKTDAGKDERLMITDALNEYFLSLGGVDFPPGIALVVAIGSYVSYRIMYGPQTQARIKAAVAWAKRKVRGKNAPVDTGDDRERKDDLSEKTGDRVPATGDTNDRAGSAS